MVFARSASAGMLTARYSYSATPGPRYRAPEATFTRPDGRRPTSRSSAASRVRRGRRADRRAPPGRAPGPAACTTDRCALRAGEARCRPAAATAARRPRRGSTATTAGNSDPCARCTVTAQPCARSPTDAGRHLDRPGAGEGHHQRRASRAAVTTPTSPLAKPSSRWLAVATTRSPTSKPPTSPVARVEPGLERGVQRDRARPGPRCTGVTTCTSADAMPSARGIESQTSCTVRCAASPASRAGTTTTSCRRSGSTGGQLAAAHRGRQPRDRAALGLPVQRRQLGHRDGAAVDEVAEHPAGADRGQLRGVADEQQVAAVGARLEQRGGQLGVEHGRLVDDDDVLVERPVGVALEPPASARSPAPARRAAGAASSPAASHSSSSRFAARPVGAASATDCPRADASRTSAATVRLLPVPGPAGQHATRRARARPRPPGAAPRRAPGPPPGRPTASATGSATASSRATPSATACSADGVPRQRQQAVLAVHPLVVERGGQRRVRVGGALGPHSGGDVLGGQAGVAVAGGPDEHVRDERPAAPRVVGPGVGQQRPGEHVGVAQLHVRPARAAATGRARAPRRCRRRGGARQGRRAGPAGRRARSRAATSYASCAAKKDVTRRSARLPSIWGTRRSPATDTSAGHTTPAAGSAAAVVRPSPGHRPASAKAAKTGSGVDARGSAATTASSGASGVPNRSSAQSSRSSDDQRAIDSG